MPEIVTSRSRTEREEDIVKLRERVDSLQAAENVKRAQAKAYTEECRRAGLDPLHNNRPEDAEAFARIDEAWKEADELASERKDFEYKLSRLVINEGHEADASARGDASHPEVRRVLGLANMFMASEDYKQLKRSGALDGVAGARCNTATVQVATRDQLITRLFPGISMAALNADALVPEDQQLFPPVGVPVRQLRVRDLVAVTTTDTDTVEWVEETTRTDAAVETSYGVAAPAATYEYARKETGVKRIPQHIKATKGNLADAGQLRNLLDNRLVYGVGKRLDTQMINGTGAGDNLRGVLETSGIGSVNAPGGTDITAALHRGITAVRLSLEDEPDAFLVHPSTYEAFVLARADAATAGDKKGQYLSLQGPQNTTAPNIWGKPVVMSTVIPADSALVGAWRQGATLYVRSGIQVAVTDSDSDDFLKGIITILAELRAAFAVQQPKAFCEVLGAAVSGG